MKRKEHWAPIKNRDLPPEEVARRAYKILVNMGLSPMPGELESVDQEARAHLDTCAAPQPCDGCHQARCELALNKRWRS